MMEAYYPSAQELMDGKRVRRHLLYGLLLTVLLVTFGAMGVTAFLLPQVPAHVLVILGVTAFLTIAIPVAIWYAPRVGLYILFGAALVFGGDPSKTMLSIPTSMIPLWWNISIIGQAYAGTGALDALVFSPGELIIVVAALTWAIRSVVLREFRLETGVFFGWIMAYVVMVGFGFVNGVARGGDVTVALWEIRNQVLFLLAYLLGANLFTERKHVYPMFWIIVICLGVQGIFGVLAYFEMGSVVGDNGIPGLDHAGSLFFNILFLTYLLLAMSGMDRRMTILAALFLPTAIWATLENNRRAGIGAFIVAFLPLIPVMWAVLPERRREIKRFALTFGVLSAIYMPIAWNGKGAWALPARSIRSFTSPSDRDNASNGYRYMEDTNLKFTRDMSPFTGYGYGRPFIQINPLPLINFPLKDFIPHNGVLWIWMRVGHFGMYAFIMIVVTVIVRGIHQLKATRDTSLKVFGALAIANLMQLFIYGKYDMQFGSPRAMMCAAVMVGILGVLPKIDRRTRELAGEAVAEDPDPDDEADLSRRPAARPVIPTITD